MGDSIIEPAGRSPKPLFRGGLGKGAVGVCRRRGLLALVLIGLGFLVPACATKPRAPQLATLKVRATPPETKVHVNGQFIGTAASLAAVGKTLRPALVSLSFTAPGYFPQDLKLQLVGGEMVVRVKLRPIPK